MQQAAEVACPTPSPSYPLSTVDRSVPHICDYIGAFQDSKQIYIVMEHATSGDLLENLLKEGRAMTERRVVQEVRSNYGSLALAAGS